jgi:hypothetical protein
MMIRAAASLATFLVMTAVAQADWQFAKWGMSLDQLIAAGKGSVVKTTPEEGRKQEMGAGLGPAVAKSDYASNEIKSSAYYYMKQDKLAAVRLLPVSVSDGPRVAEQLRKTHGRPFEDRQDQIGDCKYKAIKWRDNAGRNLVAYVQVDCADRNSAAVQYEPLPGR